MGVFANDLLELMPSLKCAWRCCTSLANGSEQPVVMSQQTLLHPNLQVSFAFGKRGVHDFRETL